MKIVKFGKVTITEDMVLGTGFEFDGEGGFAYPDAERLVLEWAKQRLAEDES